MFRLSRQASLVIPRSASDEESSRDDDTFSVRGQIPPPFGRRDDTKLGRRDDTKVGRRDDGKVGRRDHGQFIPAGIP